MSHSEQKCAHFCSEWSIVAYGTGALWDLWNWSIVIRVKLRTKKRRSICCPYKWPMGILCQFLDAQYTCEYLSLKTERCHDDNLGLTGGSHNYNLLGSPIMIKLESWWLDFQCFFCLSVHVKSVNGLKSQAACLFIRFRSFQKLKWVAVLSLELRNDR